MVLIFGPLVFIAVHLSLATNSVFNVLKKASRFHVPSLPSLRLTIDLNSEGIFSITIGTSKFPKDYMIQRLTPNVDFNHVTSLFHVLN